LEGCRTGESKITKAFGLPCASYIIHTVGPRYNSKYKTAAENALHNCYRGVLQVLIENKLRTVAMCVINSPKRGYPKIDGAHVALRTVRRFLEKWGSDIDTIVFAMYNTEDHELYQDVLRYYFPRNNKDLLHTITKFPEDIKDTNEFGAKIIKEREIRINAFPNGRSPEDNPLNKPVSERALISTRPKGDVTEAGLKEFMTPVTDTPDDRARRESLRKTPKQQEAENIDRHYAALLQQAKTEDLSDIAKRGCVYQAGQDGFGRPLIVVLGSRFPEKKDRVTVLKLLKYIIRTLDALIGQEFILVYFHTGITQPQEPEFAWLQMVYRICDRKYSLYLKNFYIVHPSLWVKFTLRLLTPFMKNTFTQKMELLPSLKDLFSRIEQEAFARRIPSNVYQYDRQAFGSKYVIDVPTSEDGL